MGNSKSRKDFPEKYLTIAEKQYKILKFINKGTYGKIYLV